MNTMIKSSNGITLVPIESRLLAERKIFLEGEITQELAMDFVKKILALRSEDSKKPVKVLINSVGGEVQNGMLIYDVIHTCKLPLEMYCIGRAYSMAALLFAAGRKGYRFMLENSELMIHEPLIQSRLGGSSSSVRSISESLQETKAKLNKILAMHTGRTEEEIDKATLFDHYFKAEEAVEFGLADKIVGIDQVY